MSAKGIHWAPASFMGFQSEKQWLGPQELSSPGEDDPHALVTSAGLQVALPGFFFHKDLLGRMKAYEYTWKFPLIIPDTSGMWYSMRIDQPWREGSDDISVSHQLAVILAHELKTHDTPDTGSFQDFAVGVLVSFAKDEDASFHVTAHYHVAVELLGQGFQEYFSTAKSCAQKVGAEHPVLLSESHAASKERYKTAAQQFLEDKSTLDMMMRQARHMGEPEDYEHLLNDMLDTIVVTARFGSCCEGQKVTGDQQWCVD
ncbi:MAG: hypothetical protein Q9168_005311 [Polycauliona sp. 1 TL-2023]